MTKYMPRKDVVIVGLGWTGAIMAQELTDEGLDVVALERGPWRDCKFRGNPPPDSEMMSPPDSEK